MKAGIYVRISDDREGLRAGVERQRQDCERLCRERGWTVAEVYEDNDISAYSGKPRPAYKKLLRDVEAGRLDFVVTWAFDRLHRRLTEAGKWLDLMQKTGVEVWTVQQGRYDTLIGGIFGTLAQVESERMSQRIQRAALQRAEGGEVSGWQGYGVRSAHEREIIAWAADEFLRGRTLASIVRELNSRGEPGPHNHRTHVKDPVTGKREPSPDACDFCSGRRQPLWSKISLRRLLLAPRIAGFREHRGQLYPAKWEPAVDRATWESLKKALNDPKRLKNGGVNSDRYLLTGLLFCGDCGAKTFARPNSQGERCYVCAGARPGHQLRRLADPVEDLVKEKVLGLLTSPVFRHELLIASGRQDTSADDIRKVMADLEDAEQRLEDIIRARFETKDVPESLYRSIRANVEREISQLQERLAQGQRSQTLLLAPDPAEVWEGGTIHQRRELIQLVVSKVVMLPARKGLNRFDPAKIQIQYKLPRLVEAGLDRWESMTEDEREAVRKADREEAWVETAQDWALEPTNGDEPTT